MKRILLLTLLSCVGLCTQILSVFAQQGEKSVGINVGYGTASSFESFRLGAEFNWNATDHIRLSPSFDLLFLPVVPLMWLVRMYIIYFR